jgi:hypothetical protein
MKKKCTKCKKSKDESLFPMTRGKRHSQCKACRNAYFRDYYNNAPNAKEKQLARVRKTRLVLYGMTEEDYQKLFRRSEGLCEICRKKPATTVDHDHLTGKVRGLLCSVCNLGLGQLGDTVESLEAALAYLRKNLI